MKRTAEVISKQGYAGGDDFGRNPYGHGSFGPLRAFWLTHMGGTIYRSPRLVSEQNDLVRNHNELLVVPIS